MRVFPYSTVALILLLSVVSTSTALASSANATDKICDPNYGQLDASGDCQCLDGFSGLGCRMCSVEAETDSCAALGSDYSCVTGLAYGSTSLSKTYTCVLSSDLQALFPDGAIDIGCDRDDQGVANCTVAVYRSAEGLNSDHLIDCVVTQCSIDVGTGDGQCGNIDCTCGSECSEITRSIVEGSLSGQPATIEVQEDTQQVSILIEGSPLPLSATCQASGCEQVGSAGIGNTLSATTTSAGENWSDTRGVVLALVACAVLAAMLLLGCCAFCCCPVSLRRKEEDLEAELLVVTSRSVKTLVFRNISCFAGSDKQTEPTCILDTISGSVSRGQVLGLLGPSGSGKTTLLNALAKVQNGTSKLTGELLVDGSKVTKDYRRIAAYVQQDDTLYSTLSVRECIAYSAQLRLPMSMTDAAKSAMVDRVIKELKLGHIAHSRIGSVGGSTTERGISGGERRRVSIGMELVTSPQILILDEPTSGLDSSSAHSVVTLIKELASHDRIVILSIHQPSARTFLLLDKIILLAKGQVLYTGAPADSKISFQDLGFVCRENDNIADFILDIATDTENLVPIRTRQNREYLEDEAFSATVPSSAQKHPGKLSSKTSIGSLLHESSPSLFTSEETSGSKRLMASIQSTMLEIRVLFRRTALNIFRHRSLLVLHIVLSLALALFGGLIFNNVTDDLAGFQNRMGAFYFTLTFFGFASMSSMDVFIAERQIFLRETGAMYYSAFSYFLAKTTLDAVLLRVFPASLFACIFYWIMGLQASGGRFLLFTLTVVLFNVAAGSICLLAGVLAKRVGTANLGATVVLLIMLLFGGFLVNSGTMPASVGWLQQLSIFRYAFEILMTNELEGTILSFNAPGYPAIPIYGEVYLNTLGMDYTDRFYDVAALALIAIVLQLVAFFFLWRQVPSHYDMAEHDKDASTPTSGRTEEGYEACTSDRA